MTDRQHSPAYEVMRPSSKRLLTFIEDELARQGGGNVTFYNDQLEAVGSRRTVPPGLSELNALGFLRVTRYQKRCVIGLSDGWRTVSKRAAVILSGRARSQLLPVQAQPQPASASTGAPA